MNNAVKISDVWLKASILGATWAASEIILGSFLHNLRIPFNGNILTAIGFILMISASYKWKDKGLFWRTGLICALMKTMSPSAIIFGPMIAIFMESVLLEISTRTLGKNVIGFLVGAALAMSWILVQKIGNFIIFYGFNIVDIYTQLMGFAEKQLKLHFDLVWMPLVLLLIVYILFGIVAVYLGMKIGKNLTSKASTKWQSGNPNLFDFRPNKTNDFLYSITWLIADFCLLIGMLFLINFSPVYVWTTATFFLIFVWTQRYKRGMRQLSKPSFWVFFVILTMLSAFAVTAIQGNENQWMDGLKIGLQMNFRAAVVIVGFAVLGTELYNPKIRNYFAKTSFKQLPVALELAFESLPYAISHLPDVKSFFQKPVSVIQNLIFQAEKRFEILRREPQIVLLTGDFAAGKTTFLTNLVHYLKEKNIPVTGFLAPRIIENDQTVGYELMAIQTGEKYPFLRLTAAEKSDIGKFKADVPSFEKAQNELKNIDFTPKTLVVFDEVGKWELHEKGWFKTLQFIQSQPNTVSLWVVRNLFVSDIIDKWQLKNLSLFDISTNTIESVGDQLIQKFFTYDDSL